MTSSLYVTEVPFLRQFCKELAPSALRVAAALGGARLRAAEDAVAGRPFEYCEIGSGLGDTLCALAAAYPRGRFTGIDINPEHVAFARGRAERTGLGNVWFLERDVARMEGELPELDFVCAHGLLSWISPGTRRALVSFATSRLKPGGVFYVSYNALPGWAAVAPLRRLLHDLGGTDGTLTERADRAVARARALRDAGARYFADNPGASEMLDTMTRVGTAYVVHEYFHDHWHPMALSDVAGEMAAAGLRFCAELPFYRNVRHLSVPATTGELAPATADRVASGTLRDYAANTFFRGDLYVRADQATGEGVETSVLDATPLATTMPLDRIHREVRFPCASLPLLGEPFETLLALASRQPVTVAELARALPGFAVDRLREAVIDVLASEQIVPVAPSLPEGASVGAHAYNLAVLTEPLSTTHPVVLASPAAGTGLQVPALQALALRVLYLVTPADRPAWLRRFVERQPVKLHVSDRAVQGLDEQVRVLDAEVERFRAQRLPFLERLGIVLPPTW